MLGAISLDLFAVLLGGATALLPVFARDMFAAGPWALGLLRAAPAVGALAHGDRADALVVRAQCRAHHVRGGRGLRRLRPSCSRCRARSSSRSLALVVLGASDMVSVVIRMTLVQLGTPDEMRGRVTAVNALFIGASNQLGEFRAGAMAALARRGAGRADRRHRHAGDRGALDAAVSAARAGRPAGGCEGRELLCRHQVARAARRTRASGRGNPTARRGCRGRRPGGRRNAHGAAWRRASPCGRRRAWSSGTSWRG